MVTNKITLLSLILASGILTSEATQITLLTDSLPSSQSWIYDSRGLHNGVAETDISSTDGSVLSFNSMGQALSSHTGGSILYRQNGVVPSADTSRMLTWTSRLLDYEYVSSYGQNHGLSFGFSDDEFYYFAGIRFDRIALGDNSGFKYMNFDPSQFHTYCIETIAGTALYNFYIDDILQVSARAWKTPTFNTVYFGDSTGGANASAEISFVQFGEAPPAHPKTDTLYDAVRAANRSGPNAGLLNTLIAAAGKANPEVLEILTGKGQHTLFAPTDAAFSALGITTANIGSLDQTLLTDILRYHIVNGRRYANSVVGAKKFRTDLGDSLYQDDGVLTDNLGLGAHIDQIDLEAANGIIHVIDAVLLPYAP